MRFPDHLKYTKDHEWALIEGNSVTVGITDHAQAALGDIVYVDLPRVDRVLKKQETFGVVESIKAVSDLYSPIAGKITAVNDALTGDPAEINRDPQQKAWLVKIEATETPSDLMDAREYAAYVESLK